MNFEVVMQNKMSGFTLIEVMVVVVILGILAAVIIPSVVGRDEDARRTLVQTSLSNVANALEMYRLDNHKYPTTQEGLEALVTKPASAKVFPAGGYLKSVPADPWDNPIQYVTPGAGGKAYDLYSFGPDGQEGGEGNNADIYYK
jgi:general secretion pathway protein G